MWDTRTVHSGTCGGAGTPDRRSILWAGVALPVAAALTSSAVVVVTATPVVAQVVADVDVAARTVPVQTAVAAEIAGHSKRFLRLLQRYHQSGAYSLR